MRALKISFLVFILSISISAQNFWQQTNGPYNSPTGATVYDFLQYDDSTIFLATEEGLIKSTDNGDSWNRLNSYKVTCLGKDKINTLYFGINGHLKRSTDAGNTWTDIPVPASIKDFVITYKDTIFVGSWNALLSDQNNNSITDNTNLANGVYRSFDYGNSWTLVNNGIQYPGVYELNILSNNSILVGTSGGGVYKSTNWGDLWTSSNSGIPANSLGYRYAESFYEDAPGNIYTGTSFGIYYSSNFGDNWSYKGNGIIYNSRAMCINKDNNGVMYAGIGLSHGVYYSTNNGNQWYHLGLGHSIYTIGWDSDSRLYVGGSSNGLHRYNTEDSSWVSIYNQGYLHTLIEVDNLLLTKNGNLIAYSESWGNFYSANSGEDWRQFTTPEGNIYGTINDSIFIAGYNNIYVSNDTGKTWNQTGNMTISSLYFEPNSQKLYLGTRTNCAIHTSTDFGQTWSLLYHFPPSGLVQRINGLYVTKTNQVILAHEYIASPWGTGYRLHQSTDHGQTWQIIYQSDHSSISHLLEDIHNNIFALAGYELLVSEDECQTWITRTIPTSSHLDTDNTGRLYRARFFPDLFYSTNRGISWHGMNMSGLQGGINDIDINQFNRIYAASTSGIFYAEADSIVVSVKETEPIKSFFLSQNYPNPFNPTTKIKYQIPNLSFVALKVYDVLGNEVETLVSEEKQIGSYEVEFNVENLSSGIYFYRLQAGDFVDTKKMVLLK